jgi:hypothetical protein
MSFPCYVGSIDSIFLTLDYNVFCGVTSEDVISMSLFMVLGTIGRMTKSYSYPWTPTIYHVTTLRFHSISVVSKPHRGLCHQSLVMVTFVVTLLVRMMHG